MLQEMLRACNVVWDSPSFDSSGSMPLGNGEVGINVWVEDGGDLLFYIAKTDAWSENCHLLKLGRVRVALTPNPFTGGQPFQQTLNLATGEIEIRAGIAEQQAKLKVRVDARHPVVIVDLESETPLHLQASLEIWRGQDRELTGSEAASAYGMHNGPYPIIESADVVVDTGPNTSHIAWYHRNPMSIWRLTLELQGLGSLMDEHQDPLLHRTFGGVLWGDNLSKVGGTRLQSTVAQTEYSVSVCLHTDQSETADDWLSAVKQKASAIQQLDKNSMRKAHVSWWREFWNRSWIYISGDEHAQKVTQGYALQRFITACAGRGEFPIKFNGSLFTVNAREENETFDADYRRWGGPYWFQNTRLAYWPMLAAGDYEMFEPLFQMYLRALPLAKARTRIYFGHEGAFFPETMYFWGAYANTNYGWSREGKHVSHVDNTYIRYYWSGALELIVLMQEYYRYTEDEAFLQNSLLPFAQAVLQFYDEHYPRDKDSKLFITPAQSLEMWQEAENPLPEIAGLTAVLDALLSLSDSQSTLDQRASWQRLRDELPNIPLRTEDGQTLIAAAERKTEISSNVENPELYAVFPYRLFGMGKPDLQIAKDTFAARGEKRNGGWHQDPIQAAYLGLTEEAKRMVVERFSTKHEGSRFPAFWGPNYDWIPDQDHGGVAQLALQTMLLQNVDQEIHLFPAWPQEWNVHFKVHAPDQAVIEGHFASGEIKSVSIEPVSRSHDLRLTT